MKNFLTEIGTLEVSKTTQHRSTNKQERWQVRTHFKRPCLAGVLVTNSVTAFHGPGTSEGICGYVPPFGIPWDLCGLLFPWPWSKGIINQELMYFSHTAILTKAQKLKRGGFFLVLKLERSLTVQFQRNSPTLTNWASSREDSRRSLKEQNFVY